MTEEGKYIYSIIEDNKDRRFGSIGINNREVNLLHFKDISAVVSSSPIINFDRLDQKEIISYLAIHQKVNEEVMKEYDLVPMAFGIIAPLASEARRILEKAYFQFKTALKNIMGKAEFVVQVWWDSKKFLEELAKEDSEIQRLQKDLSSKRGLLGIRAKLKLGKLIQQKAETQRQAFIKDIQIFFNDFASDSTLNKLTDNEMIANFSFLIEKVKEPELDSKMQALGKKYEGKLRFKYIGPMPCYSFVNINLGLGNFEIIDRARKLLGLGQEATLDEIKKVYYKLAHQYHPDKYYQSDAEDQMKKIAQAYCILKNYCKSFDERRDEGVIQKYSFKKEEVENSLIIK